MLAMRSGVINIFNDIGASSTCIEQLVACLRTILPSFTVKEITGVELRQGDWHSHTSLLCIGGGYDMGYLQSIGELGCALIRDYIHNGGSYLGICAGAYFASGECEFDRGGPLEVLGNRHIKLFPGVASGPVYGGFEYNSEKGSHAPLLLASRRNMRPTMAITYFNGGCTFQPEKMKNTRVLYKYSDVQLPAIVGCRMGKGKGILSGVHFEFDPQLLALRSHGPETMHIYAKLLAGNTSRLELARWIFSALLDPAEFTW